jgi:hypothetical protein
MKLQHLFAIGGLASVLATAPAHAIIQYQVVGPISFSTPPNSPANIVFPGFSATAPSQLLKVSLSGSTANSAPTLNYGGSVTAVQLDATPRTYAASSTPTFKFNNVQASTFTGSTSNIPLTGNPVSTPFIANILPASGSYSGTFNSITPTGIQAYFAGTPTVSVYNPNFAFTPPAGGFGSSALTLSGPMYLTYEYETGTSTVPGPLPIVGAGLAFGFSRKLRRRIQSSVS